MTGVAGQGGPPEPGRAPDPRADRFAADLEFAREIAERAGRILLERYERVGRIDHKSARDVVTEVDHLSEALILGCDPGALSRGRDPGRGVRGAPGRPASRMRGHRTRGAQPRARADMDHRSARRDGQLRQRHPRASACPWRSWSTGGPRSGAVHDPMRGETFSASADGPPSWTAARSRVSGKEQLSRFRRLAGARRAGGRDPGPGRATRDPRLAQHGLTRRSRSPTWPTDGSTPSSSRAGMSAWDVAAAGLIAERAGARRHGRDRGSVVRRRQDDAGDSGSSPRHRRTTGELLSAVGASLAGASVRLPSSGGAGPGACRDPTHRRRPPTSRGRAPSQRSSSTSCLGDHDAVCRRPQAGQVAVQERLVHPVAQRGGEPGGAAQPGTSQSDAPSGDRLQRVRTAQGPRPPTCRPSPAGPGKPSAASPTSASRSGDARRWNAPLGPHARVVVDDVAAAVPQHDPLARGRTGPCPCPGCR